MLIRGGGLWGSGGFPTTHFLGPRSRRRSSLFLFGATCVDLSILSTHRALVRLYVTTVPHFFGPRSRRRSSLFLFGATCVGLSILSTHRALVRLYVTTVPHFFGPRSRRRFLYSCSEPLVSVCPFSLPTEPLSASMSQLSLTSTRRLFQTGSSTSWCARRL